MRRNEAWSALILVGILATAGGKLLAQDEEVESPEAASPEAGDAPEEPEAQDPQASAIDGFYDGLTAENVTAKVEAFYAAQAVFDDPFGRAEGKEQIVQHYRKLLEGVQSLQVDVKEEFVSADETVAVWTMTVTHKSLNSGEPIVVDGVTHVRMSEGKVVGQKNYFDLGALLYEHTTVVGWVVRWVKAKVLN